MKEDITIRVASKKDAKELLEIYKPYVLNTAITFEYEVPSEEEFERRIENTLKRYPYLVAQKEGQIIGYTYASAFHARAAYDWAVETSIYVRQDMKKSGIGKRLYQALEDALKKQGILNMNACIAYPRGEDPYLDQNSVQFHSHLGYQKAGQFSQCGYKFGRWYDMVYLEKMIGEHQDNQPSIRLFNEI